MNTNQRSCRRRVILIVALAEGKRDLNHPCIACVDGRGVCPANLLARSLSFSEERGLKHHEPTGTEG